MTLRWYYSVDASTVLEITDRILLPIDPEGESIGVGSKAEQGAGWEGDLIVKDPGGDLIMLQFRRIYAVQDAAPAGAQVIGNWFISRARIRRMDPWSGAARQWIVSMADENSLIGRRKFVGGDTDRPEETDIAELRWFLTTTEGNLFSTDETFIDTTNPVTLDATNLLHQSVEDMFQRLMAASGKQYWVKYTEGSAVGGAIVSSSVAAATVITTTTDHGLYTGMIVTIAGHSGSTPTINGTHTATVLSATTYSIPVTVTVGGTGGTTTADGRYVICYFDMNVSELYTSTVSISNDPADGLIGADNPTSLVYPLHDDAELERDGGRMASSLIAPYKTGSISVTDTDVGDTYAYIDHIATGGKNVSDPAKITAQATRQLGELALPDDEISTTLTVQEARLNLVMHGMRVPLHATHFPNYTEADNRPGYASDFVWCRVMERGVRQIGPTTFELPLRLSPMAMAPCDDATPAGFYGPIASPPYTTDVRNPLTPADGGGVTYYLRAGLTHPIAPSPGYFNDVHFPAEDPWYTRVDGDMPGGYADFWSPGLGNFCRLLFVGDGTATLHFTYSTFSSGIPQTTALVKAGYIDALGDFNSTVVFNELMTEAQHIEVVLDGSTNGSCINCIDIESSATGSNFFGWGGVDWEPA